MLSVSKAGRDVSSLSKHHNSKGQKVCVSVCQCLSLSISVCLSVCLSLFGRSISVLVCLTCISVRLPVYPSACMLAFYISLWTARVICLLIGAAVAGGSMLRCRPASKPMRPECPYKPVDSSPEPDAERGAGPPRAFATRRHARPQLNCSDRLSAVTTRFT